MTTLQQRLERGDVVILDGAMGTELQRRGVPMDCIARSAAAMATRPDILRAMHEASLRLHHDSLDLKRHLTSGLAALNACRPRQWPH